MTGTLSKPPHSSPAQERHAQERQAGFSSERRLSKTERESTSNPEHSGQKETSEPGGEGKPRPKHAVNAASADLQLQEKAELAGRGGGTVTPMHSGRGAAGAQG